MTQQQSQNIDEWQQLQNDWQSYRPDIAKIKKRIAWVTWRMIAILILDVVTLLLYFPFFYYWILTENNSLALLIWHYSMFPLLFYGVYWDFKLRLPLFKLENHSTKGILEFYLKRVKAGVALGRLGYKFCILLVALFCLWISASFFVDLGEQKLQRPSFIIFGVTLISSMGAIMYWYRNKKLKELKRLQDLWRAFLD